MTGQGKLVSFCIRVTIAHPTLDPNDTRRLPLWPPSDVGLVVDVVPRDDIVETCGDGASHGKDEPPGEGLPQQPQDLLALLAGRQEGGASRAAVPDAGVRVLGLQKHDS